MIHNKKEYLQVYGTPSVRELLVSHIGLKGNGSSVEEELRRLQLRGDEMIPCLLMVEPLARLLCEGMWETVALRASRCFSTAECRRTFPRYPDCVHLFQRPLSTPRGIPQA